MKRLLFTTADGSSSLKIPEWDEQYHSKHGAIQEAKHVYLESGLAYYNTQNPDRTALSVLEIGFGTGLNTFLTVIKAKTLNVQVDYVGVEAYPLTDAEWPLMNYAAQVEFPSAKMIFDSLHQSAWEENVEITPWFNLMKRKQRFEEFTAAACFDVIYFDAFGAKVQPELWEVSIFERMYKALRVRGVLVTYSAKGSVRRALKTVGFAVERIPGPPGKREMLRAVKMS